MARLYAAEHRRSNILLVMLFTCGLVAATAVPELSWRTIPALEAVLLYCGLFLLTAAATRIAARYSDFPWGLRAKVYIAALAAQVSILVLVLIQSNPSIILASVLLASSVLTIVAIVVLQLHQRALKQTHLPPLDISAFDMQAYERDFKIGWLERFLSRFSIRRFRALRGPWQVTFAGVMIAVWSLVGYLIVKYLPRQVQAASLFPGFEYVLYGYVLLPLYCIYRNVQKIQAYATFDARKYLEIDSRKPVIFLRSFADDRSYIGRATLERTIAPDLYRHGPFIAVGDPDHFKPALQISERVFFARNDEWQSQVLQWIDAARLVVMIAGSSHWVQWELKQVLERGHTGKLLLIFPPLEPGFTAARWDALLSTLATSPWGAALRSKDAPMPTAGRPLAIVSDAGGRVFVLVGSSATLHEYRAATRVALHVLFAGDMNTSGGRSR